MKRYIVLYREEKIMAPADPPFGFVCMADDVDHAEEQCVDANPDGDIVWVYEGEGDMPDALEDYWTSGIGEQ